MARLAHQEEVKKTTNEQLAAIVAALSVHAGQTSNPQPFRRHLFNTNPATPADGRVTDEPEPNEAPVPDTSPAKPNPSTVREIAELKLSFQQMSSKIHQATSAAPEIDSVIASTSRTPFTKELTKVHVMSLILTKPFGHGHGARKHTSQVL
ncbi:hypothetical protein Bca52824_035365 [Brassica carinata]|uniref:Uncharacterized protein n=1 Tax=Brassica carinata TaxID=52824 RepID=A0A8X7S443_BRACI|nr:hypothetical protein Bca52824_035365 [Brassica carinata]